MNVQALLDHPHVLKIYGAFEDDTFIYMVQQLADQGDIYKTYLAQRVRLSEKELVVKIIHPLLKAIEHAHQHGVVHRCVTMWSL
jgi:serine/threonine protein kinase